MPGPRTSPRSRLDLAPRLGLSLAVAVVLVIALVDVLAGRETVLAPLMVAGPCLAAVGGGRRDVLLTGGLALALLVPLSWVDHLWGTAAQVYYAFAIAALTLLAAAAADAGAGRRGHAAESLAASNDHERRLAAIVASTDDAVLAKQLDGTITSWNAGAERMYGWSADEVLGRHISLVVPADRMGELRSVLRRIAAGQRVDTFQTRRVHRDGHLLDVSLTISPLLDEQGDVVGASAVARDLTPLAESQARVAAIVESALDCVVVMDQDGAVLEFNPAAERIFGYRRDDVIGQLLADLVVPPERRQEHTEGLARYVRTGIGPMLGQRVEVEAVRKDGSRVPVELAITRVDLPGPPIFVGFLRDMTAQRQAESDRDRLDQRLRSAERLDSLGELAGGIAHDFNNLLAVILNYAALLEDRVEGAERRDVRAIASAAERAAALTRQLLTFSRAEPMRAGVVDVPPLVHALVDLLRRTLPETVRVERHLSADTWPVVADPTRLEQIVMNLAVNGRDAMPGGGVLSIESANEDLDELAAGALPDLRPGRYVRLAISDTGHGMTKEVQAHAFEPFYTTKPRGSGTGLGLATVYGIVRQMGGATSLYSEVGRGTTVMLHLPAAEVPSPVAEPAPAPVPATQVAPTIPRQRRVLLVEDEEMLRSAVARTLESAGHHVTSAGSAEEALALVESGAVEVEVLVSDITLPGLAGPELADRLRARWPSLAVLFCTGYTEHVLADRGDPRVDMIEKPFTLSTLLERVEAVVAAAEDGDQPGGPAAADRPGEAR